MINDRDLSGRGDQLFANKANNLSASHRKNHYILRELISIIVLSFTYKASFYVFPMFASSKQDNSSVMSCFLFWFYKNECKA